MTGPSHKPAAPQDIGDEALDEVVGGARAAGGVQVVLVDGSVRVARAASDLVAPDQPL